MENESLFFEVKITPESKRKLPEEPPPVLTLAPFSSFPKVLFENVKLGNKRENLLIIRNPSEKLFQIELQKLPPEEEGLKFSDVKFSVEAHQEKLLNITWTPVKAGAWQYVVQVKGTHRFKLEIKIACSCIEPQKGKKNMKPLRNQNPGRISNTSLAKKNVVKTSSLQYVKDRPFCKPASRQPDKRIPNTKELEDEPSKKLMALKGNKNMVKASVLSWGEKRPFKPVPISRHQNKSISSTRKLEKTPEEKFVPIEGNELPPCTAESTPTRRKTYLVKSLKKQDKENLLNSPMSLKLKSRNVNVSTNLSATVRKPQILRNLHNSVEPAVSETDKDCSLLETAVSSDNHHPGRLRFLHNSLPSAISEADRDDSVLETAMSSDSHRPDRLRNLHNSVEPAISETDKDCSLLETAVSSDNHHPGRLRFLHSSLPSAISEADKDDSVLETAMSSDSHRPDRLRFLHDSLAPAISEANRDDSVLETAISSDSHRPDRLRSLHDSVAPAVSEADRFDSLFETAKLSYDHHPSNLGSDQILRETTESSSPKSSRNFKDLLDTISLTPTISTKVNFSSPEDNKIAPCHVSPDPDHWKKYAAPTASMVEKLISTDMLDSSLANTYMGHSELDISEDSFERKLDCSEFELS